MNRLTLTATEIRDLTGLVQPAAQERYLREERGIPAYRNRQNRVVVFRADVERAASQGRRAPAPNLDWLDRAG